MAACLLVAMTLSIEPASAASSVAHTDLELRGGTDYLCGTCGPYRFRPMVQVFADELFPIIPIGNGAVEIGPYAKGALLDGHIPQIAGGVVVGYRMASFEVLGHLGRAYATERIGATSVHYSGQTKGTYDLGVFVRYAVSQRYFLSVGYGHNSNGEGLGVKYISEKGGNPGLDSVYVGVGLRF